MESPHLALPPHLRAEYLQRLSELITQPDYKRQDSRLWMYLVNSVPHTHIDFLPDEDRYTYIQKRSEYLRVPDHQRALDRMAARFDPGYEERSALDYLFRSTYEEYDNKPIGFWEHKLQGLNPEVIYMLKSLWDDELHLYVEWLEIE